MTAVAVDNTGTATASPRLVALTAAHLPQALALSQALQWPYRLEDWAFALALGHGIAVEVEERLVGTALWWPYGDSHASAGMIIVAPWAQRRGIGRMLMDELLRQAGGRTIILNSTLEGRSLYAQLGFVAYGAIHQHQAVLASSPVAEAVSGTIRDFRADDHAAILALDRAASGMARANLIDALFPIAAVRVVERQGTVRGYGCARQWGRGIVVGPLVAADPEAARALAVDLMAPHVGYFVRIDVTAASGLTPWLLDLGLPKVGEVTSMVRGQPLPASDGVATLFALSNQSLG
ncbi:MULTISPECIES: GNAT family N-acetyltransferase [unclassified Azospirillum]|uniref:GNAT family N-acetyltransferase n=1 Tax=unclassified Azospirillum TaxID=2630922 RepID=UPI000B67B7A3|nr:MULTISPECIES: GNAT family N-acetyltransferase [unclassified Azospirillum]SNS15874.1 Acetyltransferase (GNAT) domain-containing protein [Azospirillum sp. RU38E]SNS33148.1 Acetyltransferase (GNAT) domain-containing protein [Azospirillum sp. RU37A]